MTAPVLRGDHHVHSAYSDDAISTIAEIIAAAQQRGLRRICFADHVRSATVWVDEYARELRIAAAHADLEVLCGVEAKILDAAGHVDLPPDIPPLDRILIADHQYPSSDGPLPPAAVRHLLDAGRLTAHGAVETLVVATAQAMRHVARPQLAHLFSLLPKIGIEESAVTDEHLDVLVTAASQTGAVVEANERWGCPSARALAAFAAAGVEVVASSDAHRAREVGVYIQVPELLGIDTEP